MQDLTTTLVAVATPAGRGGIGCVRLSGEQAHGIAARLFRSTRSAEVAGRPCFGHFLDRQQRSIDHGYLVLFPAGGSYTGEPTAELWTHGSPAILDELVAAAVDHGASLAGPGEFTYRAVRHGRIDLTRAEAIRDLIAARTLYQARLAAAQADGAVARQVQPLREELEEWIARGEAAVEFVDESETHLPSGDLRRAIARARAVCDELLAGFATGRIVRDGASLVLIGSPNAGKSSLFNRLLSRDRAIVTPVAGTTRDTLEEVLDLGGIPVRLVDTAGLRDIDDPVEGEGVRRARQARDEADLVVLVLDGSRELNEQERAGLTELAEDAARPETHTTVVVNKCDIVEAQERFAADRPHPRAIQVSARTGEGVDELRGVLRQQLVGAGPLEDPIITDRRHAAALEQTRQSLIAADRAAADGLSEELVLEDLRGAIGHLASITGEFSTEDLYDRIFSTFCIGK